MTRAAVLLAVLPCVACFIAPMQPARPTATTGVMMKAEGGASPFSRTVAAVLAGISLLGGAELALADGSTGKFALPPINYSEKDRCTFKSSSMGQANAAREKLFDLRMCDMSGKSAALSDLSGVIASEANFSKVDFKEAQLSKAYARNSKFDGADFTNAIVDRVSFDGSSMRGVIFQNAVLTSTSFVGADLENADFTEAAMGDFDLKSLCKNPTLKGENPVTGAPTKESAGCR
eukprot:TRINITY_DN5695_c0_g1_i1.p1 TRINITY_DN5695_c0_g1~~TRINITY_DN5695_c0_g1_i1.p1  ORF type:complete len:233 (-),score=63.02 TRINITY_DN5695_c0_g1_i1:269-967(-)